MKAKPDKAGYIPWNGGKCPVEHDERVTIQLRSCDFKSGFAFKFNWQHKNAFDDITAYSVIPKKTKGDTASIYDWINSKPKMLFVALETQKKINLYLIQQLEAKNKAMRGIEERLSRLEAERAGE